MSRQNCKRLVQLARAAASSPEHAYVIRTRLRRAVLACLMAIAEEEGFPSPSLPTRLDPVVLRSGESREIAAICNRLLHSTEKLCRPSEPLVDRWREGWQNLQEDMAALETALG